MRNGEMGPNIRKPTNNDTRFSLWFVAQYLNATPPDLYCFVILFHSFVNRFLGGKCGCVTEQAVIKLMAIR